MKLEEARKKFEESALNNEWGSGLKDFDYVAGDNGAIVKYTNDMTQLAWQAFLVGVVAGSMDVVERLYVD